MAKPKRRVKATARVASIARKSPGHDAGSEVSPDQPFNEHSTAFPVVGIGASAGGLEAFKEFFSKVPRESGIAFVLVQHLDPHHKSLTAELLARNTPLPVEEVENGIVIQPNHVYIIPPNRDMTVSDGVLCLAPQSERRGFRMPIDHFFRSLAEERRQASIGIVLTGTGTDGTQGIRAIKEAGGLAIVQDPENAAYDGMPRSAIATGMADFVLPIERMPESLVRYVRHPYLNPSSRLAEGPADQLQQVLSLLQVRTGYDFRDYKKSMLARRIERRMGLRAIRNPDEYLDLLRADPEEGKLLTKDFLISVTAFFRDHEAIDVLAREVIPKLVGRAGDSQPVRIWVPGCATGEEAYTIAILLMEEFARRNRQPRIQIFATDIDDGALEFARAAVYPDSIAADISPDRLDAFFRKQEDSYRVDTRVRECVMFAVQNVITDPPFSKLDMISCRNLMIYLEPEVHKGLIPAFHFGLKDGGCLFLGPSETIGRNTDIFEPV